MFGTSLKRMQEIEQQSHANATDSQRKARRRVIFLFVAVLLGIIAKWLWEVLNEYLADTSKGLVLGSGTILARMAVSLIIAGVTFNSIYNRVGKGTGDTNLPFFVAFQNGFFWQAIFDAVGQSDSGPAVGE